MAEQRSAREIERDIEHTRSELRDTLDEFADRLTFEDLWNRFGGYIRRQGDLGEGFARIAREKPVALGLTALGIGLLLFGPRDNPARLRRHRAKGDDRHDAYERDWPDMRRDFAAEARALLDDAAFDERRASGPDGRKARSDPWTAPHHREAPKGAGADGGMPASPQSNPAPSRSGTAGAASGRSATARGSGTGATPATTPADRSGPQDRTAATPSAPAGSATKTGASVAHKTEETGREKSSARKDK